MNRTPQGVPNQRQDSQAAVIRNKGAARRISPHWTSCVIGAMTAIQLGRAGEIGCGVTCLATLSDLSKH